MTFLQKKKTFSSQPPKKHYFSGFFFWNFLFHFFHIVLFTFFQHKKDKNKKCTFFFENPFLTPGRTAKTLFYGFSTQPWMDFQLKNPRILDGFSTLQHICAAVIFWSICCLLCAKNWSNVFLFRKSRSPCRKKGFFKKQQPKQFYGLKTGPILLCNILGPVFNLYLDQFSTHTIWYLFCWNHYIYSDFSKACKIQRHTKRKTALFLNTPVLIALVKMSVFFLHFHFGGSSEFPNFREIFWIGSQKSKMTKYQSNNKIN